ncbi:AlpA family phage regulatory protein [Actinoplanes sp. NPDC023714]|uniref:helix-turn-helix transcriptional regulator n=1 Tax=Actinoplanes sp. NPDC023714 TaxID=3154322 RepID=UPI0033CEEFA0
MYRPILIDSVGVRRRLGVSRQRAYQIVAHRSFPAPYQVLVLGRVWDAAEVEAWIRVHRPHLVEGQSTQMQNG